MEIHSCVSTHVEMFSSKVPKPSHPPLLFDLPDLRSCNCSSCNEFRCTGLKVLAFAIVTFFAV